MTHRIPAIQRIDEFFARYQFALARQGAVVASWRSRTGQRTGPYWRLECRDDTGTKRAVYLGRESPLVEAVRKRLYELRRPLRARRTLDQLQRRLIQGLRGSLEVQALYLKKLRLRLQGSEIRGTGHGTPSQILGAHLGFSSLQAEKLEN